MPVTQDIPAIPEKLYRRLVNAVEDYAIFALDKDGRVASWNEGAERIKGYTAGEILGRSFERFYPEEALASGFPKYELETAAREGRFEDEGWRVRKDGSRFWANVVITTLRDGSGKITGYAKVTRDLTERREAEKQARRLAAEEAAHQEAARRSRELEELNQRLREANEELQSALAEARKARKAAERATAAVTEAYRELDQFAYIASHDLKAPLRGIANLAEWISEDAGPRLEGDSAEHLRLLHLRVQRMGALINGILAYSRAGRAMKPGEPVDTSEMVADIVELIAPPENVTISIADGLPTVIAERIPLEQVFMNLVSNAVKYAGAARNDAKVEIDWRDAGNAYEFTVRDNGPGIDPEYQARIWGIFQTLAARDDVGGTGVGLAVVQKVVESRGGTVSLESAPGEGAAFRFTWPKAGPKEAAE